MIDIDQYIADFIKDAQYRIAEITGELDGMKDFNSKRYKELESQREELYLFLNVLYVGNWSIIDGYNHLDWDANDIMSEAEYLREKAEMIVSPYTTFVGVYPEIVTGISGGVSGGLPNGDALDFLYYNLNGEPVAAPFPQNAGMQTGDTPATYFT